MCLNPALQACERWVVRIYSRHLWFCKQSHIRGDQWNWDQLIRHIEAQKRGEMWGLGRGKNYSRVSIMSISASFTRIHCSACATQTPEKRLQCKLMWWFFGNLWSWFISSLLLYVCIYYMLLAVIPPEIAPPSPYDKFEISVSPQLNIFIPFFVYPSTKLFFWR